MNEKKTTEVERKNEEERETKMERKKGREKTRHFTGIVL